MTYYILDTDHLSILQRQTEPEFSRLSSRLSQHSPDLIFITIISFQEQFQGWMAFINKAKIPDKIVTAYLKLESLIQLFSVSQIFSFDYQANQITVDLRRQRIRLGTMDLRIASIALLHDAVLLTRNMSDFSKVPNLKIEDWTL
jgi:tRNA(fMet)-specific endonuclease VapC